MRVKIGIKTTIASIVKDFTIYSSMLLWVVFYLTFLKAFCTPSKSVIITINDFGEANLELLILLLILPILAYGFFSLLRRPPVKPVYQES
jgi:hypothetical protein